MYTCTVWPDTGPEVIKRCQLSKKFQLLVKTKMLKNKDLSRFQPPRCCQQKLLDYNIYEHEKIHAQLS